MEKNIIKLAFSLSVVLISYYALFVNEARISEEGCPDVAVVYNFTNEEGNPGKKCSHKGCPNKVASHGQTKNCELHSEKCEICGKLISETLEYCKECMIKHNIKF